LAYFLNPLHLGPKNPIQFVAIDIPENSMQALKQLVIVSHPFEFFLPVENKKKSIWIKSSEYDGYSMRRMPYSLNQDVEAQLV
jgi:hypothetical protein